MGSILAQCNQTALRSIRTLMALRREKVNREGFPVANVGEMATPDRPKPNATAIGRAHSPNTILNGMRRCTTRVRIDQDSKN